MPGPWWQECRRTIHLDFHTPEFPHDCFADFDPERAAAIFAGAGVQAVKVFAKDHYGHSYYNTRIGHRHRRLTCDYLAEMTRALHRKRIRVMAYYSVCFDQHVAREHPGWQQRDARRGDAAWRMWNFLCLNSPYQRRVMLPAFEEILTGYDVDGLWFDIVAFAPDLQGCVCPYCRKGFRGMFKRPLNLGTVEREAYALETFRQKTIARFLGNTRALIDKHRPGLAFTCNHALDFEHSPEADRQVSSGACEVHPHQNLYSAEIIAAALRTTGKPFECIPTMFHFGWGEWTNKSTVQLQYECSAIVAGGGNINLGDHMPRTGKLEPGVYRKVRDVFAFVKKREQFSSGVGGVPYAALLAFSGDFYWNRPVWGAARIMADGHIPYDMLSHKNLVERLKDYKLLVFPYQRGTKPPRKNIYLPPLPKLTRKQRDAIAGWVHAGGVLVFNYDTVLAECAGIRHQRAYQNSVGYIDTEGRFARDFDLPLLVRSPFRRIRCATARPLLGWHLPYAEATDRHFFSSRTTPAIGRRAPTPAVTLNRYGKGRVIYFACDPFQAYVDNGHSWLKSLLVDILQAYAPRKPFDLHAPSTVHARMTRKGGERYIHLLNAHVEPRTIVFSKAGAYPPEIMEQIVPIYDVRIEIPGKSVRRATLEPGGKRLRVKCSGSSCVIMVPRIELYDIVRIG